MALSWQMFVIVLRSHLDKIESWEVMQYFCSWNLMPAMVYAIREMLLKVF